MASKFTPNEEQVIQVIKDEKNTCMRHLTFYMKLDASDAEDIFQDSCVALYNNYKAGKLKDMTARLCTYLVQICKNQATHFIEKHQKVKADDCMEECPHIMNMGEYKEECVDEVIEMVVPDANGRDQLLESFMPIVENMKEPCRTLLYGVYWNHLSHAELAAMEGYKSASTSKTMTSRCFQKFKKAIESLKVYQQYVKY